MNEVDEMNDDDVLRAVSDSLSGIPMPVRPRPEAIMARGRAHRQCRRLTGLSLAGAAAGTAAVLGLSAVIGSGGPTPARRANPTHLAAFTVVSNPNGTTTLSISAGQLLDPRALRQALAQHGIPALVTEGSFCSSDPAPAGFSQAVVPELKPLPHQIVLVIKPSAMPARTELSIGYFDVHRQQNGEQRQQASVVLIKDGAYTCTSTPPAGPPPGGRILIAPSHS